MSKIVFSGWKHGLLKISLSKLLAERLHLPMRTAKGYVDNLLDGETIVLEVTSEEETVNLVEEARNLGAICTVARTKDSEENGPQ